MSCNTGAMYEYTSKQQKTAGDNIKTAIFFQFCSIDEDQDWDRDCGCLFLPRLPKRSRLPFVGQSFERIDRHFFRRQSPSLITTLRRSCFMGRRAPLEAWIGGNVSGCHCSMPNNIGGARTRTFFKLTNRWRSYFLAFFSEAFFGSKNASNWSGTCTERLGWM